MSALALLIAAGCGDDSNSGGGGGGCSGTGGSGGTPQGPQSIIDLRADTNRNGTIDLTDPTEDTGEDAWSAQQGAIFLGNIDDDSMRCPKGTDAAVLSHKEQASCFDGADEVVNGPEDLPDLARVQTVPWPEAPENASANILVEAPGKDFVRVFKNVGGQWNLLPADGFLTVQELRAGVELAVEGKDINRDSSKWDGLLKITLDVKGGTTLEGEAYPSGTDTVQMRIAPLMLEHHLQKAEEIYATVRNMSAGSVIFREDLSIAAGTAGVAAGLKGLEPYSGDQWTQDWMEIGYMTMPAAGGAQHKIDVYMRSVNVEKKSDPESPLRTAGSQVYEVFHGKDAAGFTPDFDINHEGSMDSLNSYGDTETIPPYEHNGKSYPMGRIFRGATDTFHPDVEMQRMLDSQKVQPSLFIDTSWLLVGHVDETITFLKMNNARGWGMGINDAAMAKKMLEDLVAQGKGDVPFFVGKMFFDDAFNEVSAEASAAEILANTEVMAESAKAVIEVDGQLDVFKNEVGITDADLIPFPFLHWTVYGYSVAYQPGTVNGISLSDTHFGVPTPHGPDIGGTDPFRTQLETEFAKHGLTVLYIEDWDLYHRLDGEVHCGSNTKRAVPTNAKWWESGL